MKNLFLNKITLGALLCLATLSSPAYGMMGKLRAAAATVQRAATTARTANAWKHIPKPARTQIAIATACSIAAAGSLVAVNVARTHNLALQKTASEKEIAIQRYRGKGPLFFEFDKKFLDKRELHEHYPNFAALLPEIADYVAEEYKQDRIVFFHGQSSKWIFLEQLYRALYELKHDTKLSKDFIHLRFNKPILLQKIGTPNWDNNFGLPILFVTLHPYKNLCKDINPLSYASQNFDQSFGKGKKNEPYPIHTMFEELNINFEYKKLYPYLDTLEKLFEEAIADQGNYGRLLVISMPKEMAKKLSHFADYSGQEDKITINEFPTSDTATIAEHYVQIKLLDHFIIKLSEEITDPIAAAKAGVKIVAFDPTAHQGTEKYLHAQEELRKFVAEVKRLQEAAESKKQ